MEFNFFWDNIFNINRKEATIFDALKRNYLFKDLTNSEIKLVQNIIHFRTYMASERIFKQGDVGVGMYIIVKGAVDIIYEDKFITSLKEDDFFGELALVEDQGIRTASAIAKEDLQVLGFFKSDLIDIAQKNPEMGIKILYRTAQVLGIRLHETTALIRTLRRESK